MVTQNGLMVPRAPARFLPPLSPLNKVIKQKEKNLPAKYSTGFIRRLPAARFLVKTDRGHGIGYGTPNRDYAEHLLPVSLVAPSGNSGVAVPSFCESLARSGKSKSSMKAVPELARVSEYKVQWYYCV